MTDTDTFTRYKEQKQIFEHELNHQAKLLEKRTDSKGFKGSKEYQKNLTKLKKEFRKLLKSFTQVRDNSVSLDKYSQELKDIRKYTTTVEGFIKIASTTYMRNGMPKEETDIYDYFSGIDSDISYICKFLKNNSQVIGLEEEEIISLIHKVLNGKKETTKNIIRSTIKKPKIELDLKNNNSGELLHKLRSEQVTIKYLLREETDYDTIRDYEERLLILEEKIKLARKGLTREKTEKRGMRK